MNAIIDTMLSHDNTTIMLVAIASLFLVLLFITLLHCYAKWFLARDGRSTPVLAVPTVLLGARGLHNLHNLLTLDRTNERDDSNSVKGLDLSVVSSIPQFVFKGDEEKGGHEFECVICLSLFEDGDKGRRLALCQHCFHVECIDMWLHSHTTCPICRASAMQEAVCINEVVVDALPENYESNVSEESYYGENFMMNMNLGERRLEDSSRLEIVIEVPSVENGSSVACQSKVYPLI